MAGSCGVISAPNSPPACRLTHVPAPGGSSLERARWRHLVQRWHDIWGGAPGRHRPSTANACGTFKRSCISTTSSVPAPLWREAEETRYRCSLEWGGKSHSADPAHHIGACHENRTHGTRTSYSSATKRTRKSRTATPRAASGQLNSSPWRSGRRFANFQRQRATAGP